MISSYRVVYRTTLLILLISVVQVNAAPISYETNQSHFIGDWGVAGNGEGLLDGVSHLYSTDNELVITDSGNSRVLTYDLDDWNLVSTIDAFSINSSTYVVSEIYQTIRTEEDLFYSVIDGNKVISYTQSGEIHQEILIPVWEFGSSEEISIAVDRSTAPDTILLSFVWANRTYEGPQIFVYDQTLNQIDLNAVANVSSSTLQFSYSEAGLPQYLTVNTDNSDKDSTEIITLSALGENNYGIINRTVTSLGSYFAISADSFVFFKRGYWFSGSSNEIYDDNFNLAGTLDEFGNFGTFPPVNSMIFLPSTNEVIFASAEKNVVASIQFGEIDIPTTSSLSTSTSVPFYQLIFGGRAFEMITAILVLALVIGIGIVTYLKRRKPDNK